MQGSGVKIGLVIFFLALTGWYLIPSFQSLYYNRQMEGLSPEELAEYRQEHFGTLRTVQEKSLKLGLDLQGGMHVTLEVGLGQLVQELAEERSDEAFVAVLAAANERAAREDLSLIAVFVQEFEARDPNARLSRYFRSDEITRRSTNDEVMTYLQQQANDAIVRAIEIIRNRVDRYGVTEPSIQRQGARRIVVELPGIDDPERVRKLLKGTARLEFRLMAEPSDLDRSLSLLIQHYELEVAPVVDSTQTDSTQTDTTVPLPDLAQTDTAGADTTFDVSQLIDSGHRRQSLARRVGRDVPAGGGLRACLGTRYSRFQCPAGRSENGGSLAPRCGVALHLQAGVHQRRRGRILRCPGGETRCGTHRRCDYRRPRRF